MDQSLLRVAKILQWQANLNATLIDLLYHRILFFYINILVIPAGFISFFSVNP